MKCIEFSSFSLQEDIFGRAKIPFGSHHRSWNNDDDIAYITIELLNDNNLVFDISFEEVDENTLEDLAGNKNKGILTADYRIDFDDDTREPSKTKIVNKSIIGRDNDEKAY